MHVPELLAPAGSLECLHAAVKNGADAVYFGLAATHTQFNARARAKNIPLEQLGETMRLLHSRGVKGYVTLNTLVHDAEFPEIEALLRRMADAHVDAVLVQDFGVARLARQICPELLLHASTQMSLTSRRAMELAATLGIRRVVLPRELSLEQIAGLCQGLQKSSQPIELECFIHGAICICYSGQCLLSSFIGRRSANRGQCAQPCRMTYEMIDARGNKLTDVGDYLLSPKDLCGIDELNRLAAAGVQSLKIEGRMKSAAYVATTVRAYRQALDTLRDKDRSNEGEHALKTAAVDETVASDNDTGDGGEIGDGIKLTDAFNRALTPGYLKGIRDNRLMDYRRQKNPTTQTAQVQIRDCATRLQQQVLARTTTLDFSVRIRRGEPIYISVTDAQGRSGEAQGACVEAARTKAITADEVREHVGRLEGTSYVVGRFNLELDDAVGLGFSTLHALRRAALDEYELRRFFGGKQRLAVPDKLALPVLPKALTPARLSPEIVAVTSRVSYGRAAIDAGAGRVHIPVYELLDEPKTKSVVPVLPRICHDRELDEVLGVAQRFGQAVVSTLGQLDACAARGIDCETHWSFNVTNAYTVRELVRRGARLVWLSPELSGHQVADIAARSRVPVGIALSGRSELMVTEHCILMAQGPCDQHCSACARRAQLTALKDRLGYCFPVQTDPAGRSHLYNSVPLDLVAALPEIVEAGVAAVRLDTLLLPSRALSQEVARVRRSLVATFGSGELEMISGMVTKGHFFRGVL